MKPPTQQYQGISAADRLADRRQRLIDAGVELFGTAGFRQTSIDEICARAGLTKRYFYESFPNRDDLLMAVYDQVNDALRREALALITSAPPTSFDVLSLAEAIITAIFTHLHAEPRHGRILFVEVLGVSPDVDRKYLDNTHQWEKLLVSFVPDDADLAVGDSGSSVRRDLLARAALGTVVGMAVGWMQNGQKEEPDEIVAAILALFGGLLGRVGTPTT